MQHDNIPPLEVVERITDVLTNGAWLSPGDMSVNSVVCGDHYHIYIKPALRELAGGEHDGERIFAHFILHINKFVRCFDKTPKLYFDTATSDIPFISASGRINGIKCNIIILTEPVSGQEPTEVMHVEGPKKGTVEQICDEDDEE